MVALWADKAFGGLASDPVDDAGYKEEQPKDNSTAVEPDLHRRRHFRNFFC
jgi:hypothetical protein